MFKRNDKFTVQCTVYGRLNVYIASEWNGGGGVLGVGGGEAEGLVGRGVSEA